MRLLNEPPDEETPGSPKQITSEFFIGHWLHPFDLVFDEVIICEIRQRYVHWVSDSRKRWCGALRIRQAVNNGNTDLHSLLRLTDESFFESRGFLKTFGGKQTCVQA